MATTTAKQTSSSSPTSSASVHRSSSSSPTLQHSSQLTATSLLTSPRSESPLKLSSSPTSFIGSKSNHLNHNHHQRHQLAGETEQDIEIIAKQISDHAEAIYQTWKARGLAPTEILNCHTAVNSEAFDKTLTPSSQPRHHRSSESPPHRIVIDEIKTESNSTTSANMSNSNLKKLVSSFVSEDKARQQQTAAVATRKTNILTSGTIKDALRKFENTDSNNTNIRPNYLKYTNNTATLAKPNNTSSATAALHVAQHSPKREKSPKLQVEQLQLHQQQSSQTNQPNSGNSFENSNKLNKNVPDVLINTIDQENKLSSKSTVLEQQQTKSSVSTAKTKPETPAKPASLLNHTPSWPLLKNRSKTENGTKAIEKIEINASTVHENDTSVTNSKLVKSNSSQKSQNDLMDKVLMEEERLINALKTGTVLNNDTAVLPEVITSTLNTTNSSNSTNNNKIINSNSLTTTSVKGDQRNWPTTQNITTNSQSVIKTATNWNDEGKKDVAVSKVAMTATSTNENSIQSNEMDGVQLKLAKVRPKNDAAVPHPDVSLHTNKSINSGSGAGGRNAGSVPAVRPFLTRGSVAERVLMFEKCPEIKALRNAPKESSKLAAKPAAKPNQTTCTTLQRHIRGSKNVYIPRFHFPHGKPLPSIALETTLQRLQAAFDAYPNTAVTKDEFVSILKICAMPFYWRMPLFHCTQLTPAGLVDGKRFCDFWKQMSVFCHDTVSRFVFILSRGQRSRSYILPEDLVTLVQDVVDTHPGLAFLKEAAEFHSRYVHTVIARIFYSVNRSWSGKITMAELRRSDLLQVLQLLEEEEDINQIMAYFSYEHFYVIYCKFWELDRDHDLFIDQNDLARHNDHALSTRIIERIFSGCVTKTNKTNNQRMSYTEFVWFLLSEEDKSHPTAVEYWFRCMDLDGDGILSMYELEYFYEEQQHRMESIGIETLPFEDCLCQMLDMIKPTIPGCITLGDLKRCKMTPIFFDTFFNLEKYMEHEQRDPFASQREDDMTDWDRYAAQEYELLVAEEGGDTHGSYDEEEDYESSIDILETHMDDQLTCGINDL